MIFESELIAGVLIKRYKRFFVDIKVKNKVITAHCPNTGSMMGLLKKALENVLRKVFSKCCLKNVFAQTFL